MALIAIYPFYKALYDLTPSMYRGVTVMVLPIWKFGAKYIMVNATRDLEDFIPQIVTFTVDLYSALFISVCMSSAGSVYLSALFIAADFGQALLEFREVRANANVLVSLLHDRQLSRNFSQTSTPSETTDLLAMVLTVTRDPSASNITSMHGARLRACLPHPLPADRIGQLQLLADIRLVQPEHCEKPNRPDSEKRPNVCWDKINSPPRDSDTNANGSQSKQLVLQGLQLLFHCEYLALVEYIECVVPIVFVTYKSVLEQLPNIVYYPGGAGNWGSYAIVNTLVFAALEIGSFLILNQFLQRKFAFSPLYQVAFVLETHVYCPIKAVPFVGDSTIVRARSSW
ncbi:hypothetical protein GQ600_7098 [Phytophthora cactorum]|nr:hypothetical protein GQ600_7098 [Phytophthora cactorum]